MPDVNDEPLRPATAAERAHVVVAATARQAYPGLTSHRAFLLVAPGRGDGRPELAYAEEVKAALDKQLRDLDANPGRAKPIEQVARELGVDLSRPRRRRRLSARTVPTSRSRRRDRLSSRAPRHDDLVRGDPTSLRDEALSEASTREEVVMAGRNRRSAREGRSSSIRSRTSASGSWPTKRRCRCEEWVPDGRRSRPGDRQAVVRSLWRRQRPSAHGPRRIEGRRADLAAGLAPPCPRK